MKKSICFLLCATIIFGITSCSSKVNDPAEINETSAVTEDISVTEETQESSIFEILPERDFEGDTFTIYIPPNPDSPVDKGTFVEDMTGESFNDVVFERNRKVEEQYNVKIAAVYGNSWDSTYGDLKKNVLANETIIYVYFTHVMSGLGSMISEGLLMEWTNVPHINFDNLWWNQSVSENLSIANKLYYTSSAVSIDGPLVLLFNKEMADAYSIENPYELVRTGKWTIEKLGELSKAVSLDLNGDGEYKMEDDQFGLEYGIQWQTPSLMYACDEISMTLDDNGYPELMLNTQKKINAYEKMFNLLYEGVQTYCYVGNTTETANISHIGIDSGRVLFCQWNLFSCEKLRDCEIEYGILPLPKYDEVQKDYMSNSWTGMYCLPIIISEEALDMVGILMESMSALGKKDVIPVYYEVLLKEKISRDEDSREMLDIVLNGMIYDVGLNFSVGGDTPGMFIVPLIKSKNPNYVSELEKKQDAIVKAYDSFYETVKNLE